MTRLTTREAQDFPRIVDVGLTGMLVTFSDVLTDAANRAALAFREAVDTLQLEGISETSTSLTSTFVSYSPHALARDDLLKTLRTLAREQDWNSAKMPSNRRLWTIPAVFGGEEGPQLSEAAEMAGIDAETAIRQLCDKPLRVMTLGFAPGQPYLGSLSENWNIPRQTGLTKRVPIGAITVAIRQIVLFSTSTPTGWRQVGLCGFKAFRPEAESPFALRPGDEIRFQAIARDEYANLQRCDKTGDGGAVFEALA